MTVAKLHKLLGQMIADGLGHRQVLVNKPTFTHNLEGDGAVMLPVCGVAPHVCEYLDGDGFTATRKDGTPCSMSCVLLFGSSGVPGTGLLYEHDSRGGQK